MKFLQDTNHQKKIESFLYQYVQKSREFFWVRTPDFTTWFYLSPAFEEIWGISCDMLYHDNSLWINSVHEEDREQVRYYYQQFIASSSDEILFPLDYRIIRPDGMVRRLQEVARTIYENGKVIGLAGMTKEVTFERRHLSELEQASYFFEFFAEKVPAAFWARDHSCNKQLYLSPGYEKIWHRNRAELYKNPNSWLDTLHPEDREKYSKRARLKALEEGGPEIKYEDRYRIFTPTNEIRWIKDTSFPIYNEKDDFIGFAGIAEDITKEVLWEQELREAKLRAEAANQAKSDFLAMISHELRTPLNAILGMAEIMKAKGLATEFREYADIISNAGGSLLALVNDVLDFVRLEAGKLSFLNEPFDLKHLFNDTIRSLKYQAAEKNIEIKLNFTNDASVIVKGDAGRIRQVLINLIGNAIKFTDEGFIQVNVDCIKKNQSHILIKTSVKDTGIGIEPDQLERIFDRFTQVDSIYQRKHGGIGLGLAITKELINAMGGHIEARSALGIGSTFEFSLLLECAAPVKLEVQEPTPTQKMPSRSFHFKILLVEDNPINQKIARIMFEDLGCKVDVLNNGQMVLNDIEALNQYDFIFMDVGLPDMSGFDITRRLREEPSLKNMPIIALTAHILERDQEQAFAAGMTQIIAKPISYEKLQIVLESYLTNQELTLSEKVID
jgi:two-component system, sensor histidine kinase